MTFSPWELRVKHRPKRLRWKEYDYGVSNSGLFRVSDRMLRRMRPDLFGFRGWLRQRISRLTCRWTVRDFFREQLWLGSIQAAIVMSVEPGRVAAYSDMLDCVAILGYNPDFLREFALRKGSRLIGVNYYTKGAPDADIVHWPGKCSTWTGFNPMIADFLTDDEDRLDDRKATLNPDFYDRCRELAEVQLKLRPDMRRSGRPIP